MTESGWEDIIKDAIRMMARYPPSSLRGGVGEGCVAVRQAPGWVVREEVEGDWSEEKGKGRSKSRRR